MSGHSGTPLFRKLGFKPGFTSHVSGMPENYRDLLTGIPQEVTFVEHPEAGTLDIAHLFAPDRDTLARLLPIFRALIKPAGMIWVSWPKKSSGIVTDISEDTIREYAFPMDLVDVKVCAVDPTWSGLKLVIRKDKR